MGVVVIKSQLLAGLYCYYFNEWAILLPRYLKCGRKFTFS
jgi:hypothetical protein